MGKLHRVARRSIERHSIDFQKNVCIKTHMSSTDYTYATSAAIRRAKAAIEKTGSTVSCMKLYPDGCLEFHLGAANDDPATEFDRLDAAGVL